MNRPTANAASRYSMVSGSALKWALSSWLMVAVVGQWVFFYYIVVFYGASTIRGDFPAWSRNTFLFKGYVAGDNVGNALFAAHALLAALIAFGGTLQLVPQIRARFPGFHRWNGRLFLVTAFAASLAGLYLVWVRGDRPNLVGAIALSLNAGLILFCGAITWRAALAADVTSHRRWGLRTYLVANAQWFIRIGIFAWVILNQGPVGITEHSDGPFNYFADFACYLMPLGILEIYLRINRQSRAGAKMAMAGIMLIVTLLMCIGIIGVTVFAWGPLLMHQNPIARASPTSELRPV